MSRGETTVYGQGNTPFVEQAFRAVRRAQMMVPGLRAQARAQSGNPRLNLRIKATGPSMTDGESIWITPPIELGLPLQHQRNLCHEYEWSGRSRCPACQVQEVVQYRLEHEVSHITQGSFERITREDLDFLVGRAVEAELERDPTLDRWEIRQKCQDMFGWDRNTQTYKLEGRDFMSLAQKFSPWMLPIMRSIEDARVNAGVHQIKPGTKRYFRSYFIEALEGGLMNPDGQITDYRSLKPDHQLVIASMFVAAGYVGDMDLTEFFDPDVVELLTEDEEINSLLAEAPECRTVRDVFTLADRLVPAFQSRGWLPEPKKKDEPEPTPQDDCSDEDSGQGSQEDQPGADQEADQGSQGADQEDQPEADQGSQEDQPGADQGSQEDQPEADQGSQEADQEDQPGADQGSQEDQPEADQGSQEADQEDQPDPGPGEKSEDEDDEEEGASADEEDEGDGADGDDGGSEEEEGSSDHGGDGEDQDQGDEGDEPSSGPEGDSEGDDDCGSSSGDGSEEEQDSGEDSPADSDEPGSPSESPSGLTDEDAAESAKEAMRLLLQFGGHEAPEDPAIFPDEDGDDDSYEDDEDQESGDDLTTEEGAMMVALNQSEWFSAASQEVGGIHVLTFDREEPWMNGALLPASYREYQWLDEDRARRSLGADPKTIVGANVSLARLAFTANRAVSHQRGLPRGRVHSPTVGPRLLTGDPNAFHRRTIPDEREYAVLVAFDFSGSTEGRVLRETKESVRACGDLLNRLPGVKFGVYGHTATWIGQSWGGGNLGIFIPTIKDFKEPWNGESLRRLASIQACDTEFDGHNIEVYRKMLEKQRATHRLLLYYTDGEMPAYNHDEETEIIQRECKHFERDPRMAILGVGMGTDSPKQFGLDTVALYAVEDLVKLVSKLRDVLSNLGAV